MATHVALAFTTVAPLYPVEQEQLKPEPGAATSEQTAPTPQTNSSKNPELSFHDDDIDAGDSNAHPSTSTQTVELLSLITPA